MRDVPSIDEIRKAVNGDPLHRLQLIEYLRDWLSRRSTRLTDATALLEGVDGIVNATLMKLVKRWDTPPPLQVLSIEQFFAYCGRTFDTIAIDQARRLASSARSPDRPVVSSIADSRMRIADHFRRPQSTPSRAFHREEMKSALNQAIRRLPDDLLFLVTEYFLKGRSNAEIARELMVEPFVITRKLQHAARLLRTVLNEDDF